MAPALLKFDFLANDPIHRVQEILALFPDGQAFLWSQAALDPTRRQRAGTYALQMDADTQSEAASLAEMLVSLPANPERGRFRRFVEEIVLAQHNGGKQSHSLNASQDDPLPAELQTVVKLRDRLMSAASASPKAVVELSARQAPSGGRLALIFTCKNPGSEAVEFLFTPKSIAVWRRGTSEQRVAWKIEPELRMGLIGGMGVLVDGLYSSAELKPGAQASLILPLETALPVLETGGNYLARLEGTIRLVGPGHEDETFPTTPFVVESPLSVDT